MLGLHHEQQHQELILTDIKHAARQSTRSGPPTARAAQRRRRRRGAARSAGSRIAGGVVEIGIGPRRGGEPFAFDNESPRHHVFLRPFALASRLVTCGEYLAFIDDGGYRRPELWLSDGWADASQAERLGRRRSTGSATTTAARCSRSTAERAARSTTSRSPRQLLRGRRLRALGRRAPADRGRVGGRRGAARRGRRQLRRQRRAAIRAPRAGGAAAAPRAALRRRLGVDGAAPTRPIRASGPRPARSANTTASSCATRWCCAAARARRRARHIRADLPQLLPAGRALAVQRHPPGARRMTRDRRLRATCTHRLARRLRARCSRARRWTQRVAEILRAISTDLGLAARRSSGSPRPMIARCAVPIDLGIGRVEARRRGRRRRASPSSPSTRDDDPARRAVDRREAGLDRRPVRGAGAAAARAGAGARGRAEVRRPRFPSPTTAAGSARSRSTRSGGARATRPCSP